MTTPYIPKAFTKDGETRLAYTISEEIELIYEGWQPTGALGTLEPTLADRVAALEVSVGALGGGSGSLLPTFSRRLSDAAPIVTYPDGQVYLLQGEGIASTALDAQGRIVITYDDLTTQTLEPPVNPGTPGASAYQVALNNGYVGTQAQWLASLQSTTPGPPGEVTTAALNAAIAGRVAILRELLDPDDHYLSGDGVNHELSINRALDLAGQATQLGYGGCGVQLRAREYGVGLSAIRVPSGTTLIGTNTGVAAEPLLGRLNEGTVIAALATLPFPSNIVETFNVALPPTGQVNSDQYAHHVLIRDLRIHGARQRVLRTDLGEASNAVPGAGLVVLHSGENCLVDRVFVTECWGHGIHFYDTATPVQIGRCEVFTNGRSGRGSGLCLTGSIKTDNQILYLGGDNNYDALLEIDGGYGGIFHLHDSKAERWFSAAVGLHGLQPGHRKVIWLRNGNGGTFVLDAMRVAMGKPGTYEGTPYDVTSGEAIVQNEGDTSGALMKVVVNGGIQWDPNDGVRTPNPSIALYTDDYRVLIGGVRQANSLVAATIRGIPWKTVPTRIADGINRPAAPDGTLANAATRIEQIIARMVVNGDWGPL